MSFDTGIHLRNPHHDQDSEKIHYGKFSVPFVIPSTVLSSLLQITTDLLSIIKDEFIFSRIFSGFFHWELFWGSFTLLYVFRAHSFDCWVIYHCIDIPQLVYSFTNWWWIWVVYSFWLFPIKLLWIFVYKSLNKHIFPFLLGNYLGVEWLDHVVGVCLIFKGTPKLFSKVVVPFYTLVSVQCVSSCSSRPYQHLI